MGEGIVTEESLKELMAECAQGSDNHKGLEFPYFDKLVDNLVDLYESSEGADPGDSENNNDDNESVEMVTAAGSSSIDGIEIEDLEDHDDLNEFTYDVDIEGAHPGSPCHWLSLSMRVW